MRGASEKSLVNHVSFEYVVARVCDARVVFAISFTPFRKSIDPGTKMFVYDKKEALVVITHRKTTERDMERLIHILLSSEERGGLGKATSTT